MWKGWFGEKYVGNYLDGDKRKIIISLIMSIHNDAHQSKLFWAT